MPSNQGFTGTVVSGTGATYSVTLNTGPTVSVTQLQIDPTETIPAGTKVIVIQIASLYYMAVPGWLAAP